MSVVIFGFWNVPGIRNIINPLKLFTIGIHEFSHMVVVRSLVLLFSLNIESGYRQYLRAVEYYE